MLEICFCFRGSESDVLDRYTRAAVQAEADLVIRVTSDCPLIDPAVTDEVIRRAEMGFGSIDYVSNVIRRTFPRGLDTEAFSMDVLRRVDGTADTQASREHVTHFILNEARSQFVLESVENPDGDDLRGHRWTVDTVEDLHFMRALFREMPGADALPGFREIAGFLEGRPDLVAISRDVVQKKAE